MMGLKPAAGSSCIVSWNVPLRLIAGSLVCLLFLLTVLVVKVEQAAALSPDGLALLQFKEGITDDPEGSMSDWKESDDTPCKWQGVRCGPDGSSVSGLQLYRRSLKGTLSSSLGSLANLTYLHLGVNKLAGPIPDLNAASLLTFMDLGGNGGLNGRIPGSISRCRSLKFLSLWRNSLSGPLPRLDGLTNLTVLHVDNNHLSGLFPNVSALRQLEELHFGNNNFTSADAPDLAALHSLKSISIAGTSDSKLQGALPPGIASMPYLTRLSLPSNNFSGQISDELWYGKAVREVDLSNNRLTGSIPGHLLQQPLTILNLSSNLLTGAIPDTFNMSNRRSLLTIDVSNNQLEGFIPSTFGMANVGVLRLQDNRLSGDMGSSIWSLSNSSQTVSDLTELQLQGNQFTGRIGAAICANWESMQVLDLSRNPVELDRIGISIMLDTFMNLKELRLSNISSSGSLPATLTSMKSEFSLEVLDLSHSNLVDVLSQSFLANASIGMHFPNLTSLDLSGNGLSGQVPISLLSMPNLLALNLSGNSLSGHLPRLEPEAFAASAFKLETLDLSHNNLDGRLVESLLAHAHFLFPNLKYLNLSGNRLTGPVPTSVAWIRSLSALNLSDNQLSGQLPPLPPELSHASFFAGNRKLCGAPLKACRPSLYRLVLRLVIALVACGFFFSAGSCLLLAWRLRVHSKLHQQDADLIAALRGQDGAHLMSLTDLRRATSNFSHEIGVGGFGTVYKGKLPDGTLVAVKKSKRQEEHKGQFLNEVKILSQVHHRNLVRLLGCCMTSRSALLVFEFVPNGTVEEYLRGKDDDGASRLTWKQRLRVALQTAEALDYLHSSASPPIYHRDVKTANILLDEEMNAKVADFGISKLTPTDATHVSTVAMGTRGYIDPEYHMTFQLTAKSDVYGFGVVLLELISGQAPMDFGRGENPALISLALPLITSGGIQDIIDPAISNIFRSASGNQSILAVGALAVKCLELRSKARPTMKEVSKELHTLWLQFDTTCEFSNPLAGMEVIPEDQILTVSLQGAPLILNCSF